MYKIPDLDSGTKIQVRIVDARLAFVSMSAISRGQTTSRGLSEGGANRSKLEQLHGEARTILEAKAREIAHFTSAIEEAEAELAHLQDELAGHTETTTQLRAQASVPGLPVAGGAVTESVRAEHEAEIARAEERHQREVQKLRARIENSVAAAEKYSEERAQVSLMTKNAELKDLRRQVEEAKAASNLSSASAAQSHTKLYQQKKNASIMHSKRLQFLESQLGEISAVARDEIREIKAKTDECLAAVDVREREHKNEVERYEQEIAGRERQYQQRLSVLAQQFASEKQRLEQSVNAATQKTENLTRILAQLERQNEKQLHSTLHDVERMRTFTYQSQSREADQRDQVRSQMSSLAQLQRQCAQAEQELGVIENELGELREENRDLKIELQKLDRIVHSTV
jgi:chromosome segregation ATPase